MLRNVGRFIRMPYGEQCYAQMRTLFPHATVDKTNFIPLVSNFDWMLFRPRRWGKTLTLSMIEKYFNITSAKEYDVLFKGTVVDGMAVKPASNSKFVFTLNLSGLGGQDMTHQVNMLVIRQLQKCLGGIRAFIAAPENEEILRQCNVDVGMLRQTLCNIQIPPSATMAMHEIFHAIALCGGKSMLLIDEYDSYPNKVWAKASAESQLGEYKEVLVNVLETAKTLRASSELHRIILMGITPLAIADYSGFNMAKDLTHNPIFGSFIGFTDDEVRRLVRNCHPTLREPEINHVLQVMKANFNGIRFTKQGSPMYNPQQCLSYLADIENQPQEMRAMVQVDCNAVPAGTALEYSSMRWSAGTRATLRELLLHGSVVVDVVPSFRQDAIGQNDDNFSKCLAASFFYYHGILSFTCDGSLAIPALITHEHVLPHLKSILALEKESIADLRQKLFAQEYNEAVELLKNLIITTLSMLDCYDDAVLVREVALKTIVMTILSLVGISTERNANAQCFVLRSGYPLWGNSASGNLFVDLLLTPIVPGEALMFEFKYLSVGHLATSSGRRGPNDMNKSLLALSQELLMKHKIVRHSVEWNNKSIEEFVASGRTQLIEYKKKYAKPVHAYLMWGVGLPSKDKAHFYIEAV
eukprot:TRINITY_DN13160_c0_g1_i1.p1 TRINITY_DN13160_c0_g1~~TRINITY_DN13160_c0_g1_i1.p1  ORF type:complete len:639 (+),score=97.10 TRINITY_DN13160_c0_g1_i1:196-2112(+)